jgi:hypothetical protein
MASQDKEVPQEARKPFGRSSNMATSMFIRIMKDILLTISDVSSCALASHVRHLNERILSHQS